MFHLINVRHNFIGQMIELVATKDKNIKELKSLLSFTCLHISQAVVENVYHKFTLVLINTFLRSTSAERWYQTEHWTH